MDSTIHLTLGHACCAVRKVESLGRALAGAAAWITGVRAAQSAERANMRLAVVEPRYRLIKGPSGCSDWGKGARG